MSYSNIQRQHQEQEQEQPSGEVVTVKHCNSAVEWDAFVNTVPWSTGQHTYAWGRALVSSFGSVELAYRLFYREDKVIAALPISRFSVGGLFHSNCSNVFNSYGGALIHSDHTSDSVLLEKITQVIDLEAKESNAFETRIVVPPMAHQNVIQCSSDSINASGNRRECPILNLNRPLLEIQKNYNSSVRRAIRRGYKEGVSIVENAEIDLISQAFPIYRETMKRIGGSCKPWRFLESLLDDKVAVPFVAQKDGRPIGVVILLVSPHMAVYWISSADLAVTRCRPTNVLIDTAIRWCHEQGISKFSFGETPCERPGLIRFKYGWGPEPNYSTTIVRSYRPWVQRSWTMLEPVARKAYATWENIKSHGGTIKKY